MTPFARVECAIGAKLFNDFLTLVFVDGRWQIISTVFHFTFARRVPTAFAKAGECLYRLRP